MLDHAVRAINRIVKAIDGEGQFLWRVSRLTFNTTDGDPSYDLNATCFAVDAPMRYTRSGENAATILQPWDRDQYMKVADRTVEDVPSHYYIEKSLTGNGRELLTAYLWPTPDATGDTVEYAGAIRAKDLSSGSVTTDFPSNWNSALVYALSAELAPAYQQPGLVAGFRDQFEAAKAIALNADNERQDLYLVVG